MYKAVSESEFIATLRRIDEKLKSLKLGNIEIDKGARSIKYNFICEQTVTPDLKEKILNEVEEISPPDFKGVEITIKKIVTTIDVITLEIYKFVTDNFPSISIFLKPTDVIATAISDVIKYVLRLDKSSSYIAMQSGVIRKINEHLSRNFCGNFVGSTEEKAVGETVDLTIEEVFNETIRKAEHRTIKVQNVIKIDDQTIGDTARYIEDLENGTHVICGKITKIRRKDREPKPPKKKGAKPQEQTPFFIIEITDTTGTIGGLYFSRKYSLDKIAELKEGDEIIALGDVGTWKDTRSFTFRKINRCTFPPDFVKKEKLKNTAPANYRLIFPEKAFETVKVESVFDDELELPQEVKDTEYVVFDLETTGTDVLICGITEIGAVKIRGGKIVEHFTTLVKPDYPISQFITDLTGIDEEMVKDAPRISEVIPDFMKFIEKAVLIAHNAPFDMKFITRFANADDYEIKNDVIDTLVLSRKVLPPQKKYDLHSVADYFGIAFRHHRALSDAYATAQAFLELMKLQAKKQSK